MDIPCQQLEAQQLAGLVVSERFVERIAVSFARRFSILGFDEDEVSLAVATPTLDQLAVLENVGTHLGRVVRPLLADGDAIGRQINQAYGARDSNIATVVDEVSASTAREILSSLNSEGDLLDTADRAPLIQLVSAMLFEAVKRRASDVHVQPYADKLQIRLRIDGVLYDYLRLPLQLLDETVSRIKIIAHMNIAEKRLPQDGRTTVSIGERRIDLRVSTLPTCHGERVVLRLLDKSARLCELSELGMGNRNLETFRRLIGQTHGLLLVTGPTGSGKSTTLYAAMQELDHTELNIVTLEDPIEYQLEGISQTQVSDKKGMTFATGLRTVLRQDPDVIMVGEIRDEETARMAIQSSQTGHLVLSTMHTNDAASAVTRLVNLGVEPYLVAGSLLGVMAQRLVRRVCPDCQVLRRLTDDERRSLYPAPSEGPEQVAQGRGCARCLQTGYYERIGIFELLEADANIADLISRGAPAREIKQAGVGTRTLRREALHKLEALQVSAHEVLRVTHSEPPVAPAALAGRV